MLAAVRALLASWLVLVVGCGGEITRGGDGGRARDAAPGIDGAAAAIDAATVEDAAIAIDGGPPPEPCTTRITYGSGWIHGPEHPAQHDDAAGIVDWDGNCTIDGPNSYATLSNGWR